jgi:hypothetical protein
MSFLFKQQPEENPLETIDKLADRILSSTHLEDRRAAVLSLKGLTRDFKLVSNDQREISIYTIRTLEQEE